MPLSSSELAKPAPQLGSSQQAILAALDANRPQIEALSQRIHAHPELAFHEHQASSWLCEALAAHDFAITRPLGGLDTAFRARYDFGQAAQAENTQAENTKAPTIALLAEYDALPDMGHACGHNLICSAAVAAAIALRQTLRGTGGSLQVIGTPAEEGGGGKILLLEQGVFTDIDAALMFHPGARTMVFRGALAATRMTMKFYGKAAHAASSPHSGINALDACIGTFNAINALRQQVKDETRIHGIISHGGSAPNIIPEYAEAKFIIRHRKADYVQELRERVMACARGAATAAGARVEFVEGLAYTERNVNPVMAERFGHYLELLGEEVKPPPEIGGVGSSDFGNLSQALPAIHPYIAMVPEGTSAHTPAFAAAAGSPKGMEVMHLASQALALTAADLLCDHAVLQQAQAAFQASLTQS